MTVLLHFGALHSGKDLNTVIKAIADIPSVQLVHAGKITSGDKPIDSPRLTILDRYISEEEKKAIFAQVDAVVLSYKFSFKQTASMFWEAMAQHKPVIASDNEDIGKLVRRYGVGLLFTPENVLSCSDAIYSFTKCSIPELEYLGRNCEKFCEEYSMANWAKRFKEIVKGL